MKNGFRLGLWVWLILGSWLWCHAAPAPAGSKDAASKTPPAKRGAENANAEPEVPLSIFSLPTNPKEGRDPFFPNSNHPFISQTKAVVKAAQTNAPVTLVANGIVPFKLIMICGKTFSPGEEGDVRCGAERTHIHCISIKEDSAIVKVDGAIQEVRMREKL